MLAVAWLVSGLHVTGTLLSGRAFGVEATLALLALFVIPVAAWPRRGPSGSSRPEGAAGRG